MDRMLIVGDGPVADAIAPMAGLLGWEATVAKTLQESLAALPAASAVVVTSHDLDVAGPALEAALAGDVVYIGGMGSRRTQDSRRDYLTGRGVSDEEQQRVHGPAGLDIGADGPSEIALSILAELVATVRGRAGAGSLKDRTGPIHPELGPGEAFCPTG
jgi:xanthine/CO dehydrogenase XdhC/CoxF family maturation factor